MTLYSRIKKVAATLVGITLFVSGSFKLMDPVGTGLIVASYGNLFGISLSAGFAEGFGWLLSLTETLLGVGLVSGVFRKPVRIAATALIGVFTVVTAILLGLNPAMDCGCFGQVLQLSHTASFVKNLVLLALCALMLFPHIEAPSGRHERYLCAGVLTAGVLFSAVYMLLSIPPDDFTEFRPGIELAASQADAIQAEEDVYLSFIYEKDGKTGSFPLSAIEKAEQEGWTFVRQEVVERSAARPLDEVVALPLLGRGDSYADTLAAIGQVMVVSVYDVVSPDAEDWAETAAFLRRAEALGVRGLLLVSEPLERFDALTASLPDAAYLQERAFQTDRKKLLALNRDNGGATWFADGMLVEKWSRRGLPSEKALSKELAKDPVEAMMISGSENRMKLHGYFLYALAVALLL